MMGNVEDGDTAGGELAYPVEKSAARVAFEGCGGLVEQHALGAAGERPGDLDDLELLDRQVPAERPGCYVKAPIAHDGAGPVAHRPPADQSRGGAEEHVLGDRQVRHDHRVLEDRGDPLVPAGGVADAGRGLTAERHRPRVRLDEAGQDRDQRRLAGAVAADPPEALSGLDRQADVVQGAGGAETLLDAGHLDERLAAGSHCLYPSWWPARARAPATGRR